MDFPLDILIPTYRRPAALAVTLTSLAFQEYKQFRVLISDQSEDEPSFLSPEVNAALNVLYTRGHPLILSRHLPRLGMAEQRQFLFEQSSAPYLLYLDDDLILESYVINNLLQTIQKEQCGFVGSAVIGLSYLQDIRPNQQAIELWESGVRPECVRPGMEIWQRHVLHNAANLFHVQQRLKADSAHPLPYKIAWVGGCILYDRRKLMDSGAFTFWRKLPPNHSGEDVLAQLRVMDRYGGCGIIPSGVYHQELQTTIKDRQVDAPIYLSIDI